MMPFSLTLKKIVSQEKVTPTQVPSLMSHSLIQNATVVVEEKRKNTWETTTLTFSLHLQLQWTTLRRADEIDKEKERVLRNRKD